MNWIPWALRAVFAPVHVHLQRMLLLMHTSREQDGITIYANPKDGPCELVYERIAAARRLLERVDPARSRRVRALLPNVLVMTEPRTGFWSGTRTCLLERELVVSRSDAYLACVLVHEATHARLHRHRIPYTPRSRGRVEAVCIREQNAFLDRLPRDEYPGTDRLIEYLADHAAAELRGDGPAHRSGRS